MYISNITDDYNDTLTTNTTDDYKNNCTIHESDIDIIIPTLILTIPCGLSFICLMSLMVYTLIKPFFNSK